MRGRVLFRSGPHASRLGYRALPTAEAEAEFRRNFPQLLAEIEKIVAPFPGHDGAVPDGAVPDGAIRALKISILVAMAEARQAKTGSGTGAAKDITSRVTRDDRIAQLEALSKISDDPALVAALRSLDDRTRAAIDHESHLLIAEEINKNGVFVDDDGAEWHFPVSIEIPVFIPQERPRITLPRGFDGLRAELAARGCDICDPAAVIAGIEALSRGSASGVLQIEQQQAGATPAYRPMGVTGLRQAITNALERVHAEHGKPGNRPKAYQQQLARACWNFWKATVRESFRDKAWQTGQGEKVSEIVQFAGIVFAAAGFVLSPVTLAEIMNRARGN